jgi:hypothetical protein
MLGLGAPVGLVADLVEGLRIDARAGTGISTEAAEPPMRPSAARRSRRYFIVMA